MTKAVVSAILVLAFSSWIMAQEAPKVEVFGGYSYAGSGSNGFDASATANFNKWFGLTADVGGQFSKLDDQGFTETIRTHSFLFGPTVSLARTRRVRPFVHALFGVSKIQTETDEFGPIVSFHDTSVAMALGGGLDLRINDHFAIRAVQLDYLRTHFFNGSQNKGRITAGIVLRFGRK